MDIQYGKTNTESEKAFFQAALDGDINTLAELLSQKDNPVDINCILSNCVGLREQLSEDTLKILGVLDRTFAENNLFHFRPTALLLATCQRHTAVIAYLLSQGAAFIEDLDEEKVNFTDVPEIAVATLHNDIDSIRVILTNDWTQVFQITRSKNIVALAAESASAKTLRTIISLIPEEKRLPVLEWVEDIYEGNALSYALNNKKIENAAILLEHGLEIDQRSLFVSVRNLDAFRFVEQNVLSWEAGVSWLATDEDDNSLLHLLLDKLNFIHTTEADIVDIAVMADDLIKKYGLDVNASGFLGESVLHLVVPRSITLLEFFCQRGAHLMQDDDGRDPIESLLMDWSDAEDRNLLQVLKILKRYHLISELSPNSLCIAAHLGLNDIVKYLLNCQPENENLQANAVATTSGLSVLQVAAASGKKDTIDVLLAQGADPHYINFNGDNILNTCAIAGQFDLLSFFKEQAHVQEVFNKQGKTVRDFLSVSVINTKNPVDFKVLSSFSQVTATEFEEMMDGILRNISLIDAKSLENILRTVKEIIAFKNYSIICEAVSGVSDLVVQMNKDINRDRLLTLLENSMENIMSNIVVPMINSENRGDHGFILFSSLLECVKNHKGMKEAIRPYLKKDFIYPLEEKYNECMVKFHAGWEPDMYRFLGKIGNLYQHFSPETHQKWYQFFMSDITFKYKSFGYAKALNVICFSLSSEETLALINHVIEKTRDCPEYEYRYYATHYLRVLSNHPMHLALCEKTLSAFSAHKIFAPLIIENRFCAKFIKSFPENEWGSLYEIYYKNMKHAMALDKNSGYFSTYHYLFKIFMTIDTQGILFDTLREDMMALWRDHRENSIENILLHQDCRNLLLNNMVHYFHYPEQYNKLLQEIVIVGEKPRSFVHFEAELICQYSHGILNNKFQKSIIQEQVVRKFKDINTRYMGVGDALEPIYLIVHNDIRLTSQQHDAVLSNWRTKAGDTLDKHQALQARKGEQDFPKSIHLLAFLIRFLEASPLDQREVVERLDFHAWWRAEQFKDIDGHFFKKTETAVLAVLKTALQTKPAAMQHPLLIAYQPGSGFDIQLSVEHMDSKFCRLKK